MKKHSTARGRSPRKRKSSPSPTSEESESEIFIVESIKGKRTNEETGCIEYFIKWKGYPAATNTWETVDSIQNWKTKIDAYEKELEIADATTDAISICSGNSSRGASPVGKILSDPVTSPKRSRSRSSSTGRAMVTPAPLAPASSSSNAVLPKMPKLTPAPLPKKPKTQSSTTCKATQHNQYEIYGYSGENYCYRLLDSENSETDKPQPSTSSSSASSKLHPSVKREILRKTYPIPLAGSFETCVETGEAKSSIDLNVFFNEVGLKYTEPPFDATVLESCPIGLVPIRVLALMKLQGDLVYYVEWRPMGVGGRELENQKTYSLVKGKDLKKEFAEDIVKFFDTLLLMDDTWACKCREVQDKDKGNFKPKVVKFKLESVLERSNVYDIESGRHTRGMELLYYLECPPGAQVDRILNVYIHDSIPCYVVKWKGERDAVLIRGSEFRKHFDQAIIQFFQSRIKWVKPRNV